MPLNGFRNNGRGTILSTHLFVYFVQLCLLFFLHGCKLAFCIPKLLDLFRSGVMLRESASARALVEISKRCEGVCKYSKDLRLSARTSRRWITSRKVLKFPAAARRPFLLAFYSVLSRTISRCPSPSAQSTSGCQVLCSPPPFLRELEQCRL